MLNTQNIHVMDWETTTHSNGNPFDSRNKAVCIGYWNSKDDNIYCDFESFDRGHGYDDTTLVVGFNLKFDLHWSRRQGYKLPRQVWDCQLAEFILSGQTIRYPSLDSSAFERFGESKDITVEQQYWSKGIDTQDIPTDILSRYCKRDIELTRKLFFDQVKRFQEKDHKLLRLFLLQCEDLLVLEEMEWNGQKYDQDLCRQRADTIQVEIESILKNLESIYPDIPINFNSGDQLSAFLYGGNIPYEETEHVGFYKNGKPKYKKVEKLHILPRLIDPIKGSELKKEGYFATDEPTLRKLRGRAAKKFVGPLLRLAEFDKLRSTYYLGLPKKQLEYHWPDGYIYGQFNQCVASTGRLSSSNPNLQNFAGECLDIFISRFE